jgi:hypothetical protein
MMKTVIGQAYILSKIHGSRIGTTLRQIHNIRLDQTMKARFRNLAF